MLLLCVLASIGAWRLTLGTVSVRTPRAELTYRLTIASADARVLP